MKSPKFIDVEGIRTRFFEAGQGDPLVLIHGGHFGSFNNASGWSLNFGGLSSLFHVYAFDKIGQGHSDNPESDKGYTMARTIQHCHDFLLAINVSRVVLVGHSRGALPAARIAVEHPELVGALVLVASNTLAADHPSTPTNFYESLSEKRPSWPDESFVTREPVANSYSRDHITHDFIEEMMSVARLPKTEVAKRRMEHLYVRQFLPDMQEQKYDTLDLIRGGRLKVPTLVAWGLNDPSAPVILAYELFQHIARSCPLTQCHIFNHAGHYVFREHPHGFNQVVKAFIDTTACPDEVLGRELDVEKPTG